MYEVIGDPPSSAESGQSSLIESPVLVPDTSVMVSNGDASGASGRAAAIRVTVVDSDSYGFKAVTLKWYFSPIARAVAV